MSASNVLMTMTTNERAEHKRELGRIRANRHYERHREQVKARVKSEYQTHKAEILDGIRERLRSQIDQAIATRQYVLLNERESKYRQCDLCRHYSWRTPTEQISPTGDLVLRTFCPYCRKNAESVIYELS
jgi:hypothetical protein